MHSNNIMIVEDERIVAADLQLTLEEFGYSVVGIASSGEGAISKADALKPDLILMDIMLKGEMNGIQAAYNIGNHHDIPIIYITAFADNSTIKHALDTNPFGYILKPFKKKDLKTSIEVALNVRRSVFEEKGFVSGAPESSVKQIGDEAEALGVLRSALENPEAAFGGMDSGLKVIRTVSQAQVSEISLDNVGPNTYFFRSGTGTAKPAGIQPEVQPAPQKSPFADILDKHNTNLFKLVSELADDAISQRGINLLIKVSYKLAVFKVKKNINKIFNLNKRWDLSVEDIAVEGISGLFVKNSKRNMLNLKYALINWDEAIKDNMDALFFLNKAVGLAIEQCINKMIRDSDPTFAKVLDTLNYTIKRYDYSKVDYFGIMYIVKNSSGPVTGNTIDYEEFNNIPLDLNMCKKDMLAAICRYLEECTVYFPAIPLNPLIERILGYSQNSTGEVVFETPSHFSRISIDDLIVNSLGKIQMKLQKTYVDSGKLSAGEGDNIFSAIKDIAFDLREGNTIWQLSDYVKAYKEDLTKEEYKEKYQFVIEYLVKMFKQMIVKKLE